MTDQEIYLTTTTEILHEETLDSSDAFWREENICNYTDSKSIDDLSNYIPEDWVDACCLLRRTPESYPGPPVVNERGHQFNLSNFNHFAGGCKKNEWWAMCEDINLPNGHLKMNNASCYEDLTILPLHLNSEYGYPIYGIIFPILVTFAIIANVFVVLVLSRKHMQSPTNTVLLYMALADLIVGIVPLPFTFYWFSLKNFDTSWRLTAVWCYMYHYLFDTFPPICHNVAIWLTVLLAAQRYVYIEFPVYAQTLCTIKNVRRISAIIVLVSIICGSMRFGDAYHYHTYNGFISQMDDGPGGPIYVTGVCLPRHSVFVRWHGGPIRYLDTYFWIRAIIFVWTPSLLLICLNVLLIKAIHRAQQRRERLLNESRNREANRQKESNNTSTMLAIIVSIFLVINCPQGLNILVLTLNDKLQLNISFLRDNQSASTLAMMIDNMLIIASYPLNFAIYCSMSTQFRDTFKNLFCTKLTKLNVARRESSYYGYTPVEGRTCAVRNGYTQESTNSLQVTNLKNNNNPKMKKSKVGTKPTSPNTEQSTDDFNKRDSLRMNKVGAKCQSPNTEQTEDDFSKRDSMNNKSVDTSF